MKNLRVINYEIKGAQIIAHLTDNSKDCEYCIDRAEFEDWLTDGTGIVDLSITHHEGNVITEVPIKEPIENYWQLANEISDRPVLEHIKMFLSRNAVAASGVKAEFIEEHLKDIFRQMEPGLRADAYASLLEYGMLKKEYGEESAGLLFRKILMQAA